MTDFSDYEKALMLDTLIDELITAYENKQPIMEYRSRAEMVGYTVLARLHDNGFVTNEGILGK